MIISYSNIRLLDAAMRWPGPQLAGQRVATLSGHTGLLGPVRHRGRPLVVGELPSQQTWGRNNLSSHDIPISHYYSLVSAASSVAWPRRLLRFLRLASIATCGLGAVSTGRPLAGQLIRPGAVSAHRAGPVTTRSCGGRIIWSLLPLLNLPRLADADSTARTTNIRTV